MFDSAAPPYQEALSTSGYSHVLQYEPPTERHTKKKNRKRNVTWFNPPFSASVKTNVGREFLKLLNTAFPANNPLHKLFTRQTVKVSYKCMPNMAAAVSRHNVKVIKDDQQQQQPPAPEPGCNCINGTDTCPAGGKCLTASVVYRATVTETVTGKAETYTGMTGNTFKDRWYGHSADMRKPENRIKTRFAAHVWDLNDNQKDFDVKWDFIDRATTFNPITRKCRLCLKEKFHIMYNPDASTLNKRQEIFSTCRHRTQKLLINAKT